MSAIEKAASFFRIKTSGDEHPNGYSNWEAVLEQLKKEDPNNGNFYMLTQGKGTDKETRSRFLNHKEALETVFYIIEKNKTK